MSLFLHNTLSRRKEEFVPLDPALVRLYVCGPTVYDRIHIGNARAVVVFDLLYRLLRRRYGADHVRYVRNITDVDDKINQRAADSGEPISALTARTTLAFHQDIAALGVLPPDIEPRATAHIAQMIAMIETLIARGHAYEAQGNVLFEVATMADYGRLSGRTRDEMVAGARVEVAPYKRDPADFVLWKPSTPDLPGWDSPWGRGRPGWHIECSAMSREYLGASFDIHGGGTDLVFPHHENELAQSRCATDEAFARYWVHNGHLTMSGEKMAKSVGNVVRLGELLATVPGEAIRLALLSGHYHQPMDWSPDLVRQSKVTLDRLYQALRLADVAAAPDCAPPPAMVEALEDDLNTPLALAHLHEASAALNKAVGPEEQARCKGELLAGAALLGLLGQEAEHWFHWQPEGAATLSDEAIAGQVELRLAARKARDWAAADRIRKELAEAGVVLEDSAGGTTWRRG